MEQKTISVKCSFCGKEMECPQDMEKSEKHMCYACFKKLGNELPRNMEKIHVEFPKSAMEEMLPEVILMHMMEEAFPKVWNERKSELKGLSSKELAEQMFAAGVGMTAEFMVHLGKETGKEKNTDTK